MEVFNREKVNIGNEKIPPIIQISTDFYIDKLTKIKAAGMAEETTEQEPFSDVKYLSDNIYAECEG